MLGLLFYSTMSCANADALMIKIKANDDLHPAIQVELVETIKDSVPECRYYWDAND